MTEAPPSPDAAALARLRQTADSLRHWLVDAAYPIWSGAGYDRVHGGFHEKLGLDGLPVALPRRARVQPRQIYAMAQAPGLGWTGDAEVFIEQGLGYFLRHYRKSTGLFRASVAASGLVIDNRAFLYDQAFALLALADAQTVLGARADLISEGRSLRAAILADLKHPAGGFVSGDHEPVPLLSNPHMHLLEACLAWIAVSDDAEWREIADEIGQLALSRFIDPVSGALREHFDAAWQPVPGIEGRIVEPGHQFEWAWLLTRWNGSGALPAASRLIEIGAIYGVRDGFAINALLDDFAIHDGAARLWPQTEWLKATVQRAAAMGPSADWAPPAAAAAALTAYLQTAIPGLWRDRRNQDGSFIDEPAPASSFYHIVAAIAELSRVLVKLA